jgi:hypothetical protein
MSKRLEPKMSTDPATLILIATEKLEWGAVIPGPDRENDTYYGMIIGKNEFIDLVYSYLPPDFDKILKAKVLKLDYKKEEKIEDNI